MPAARLPVARVLAHTLLIAQVAIGVAIVRNWSKAATYRLYLDRRVDAPAQSTAAQYFDIKGDRSVPRIVMHGDDRVSFQLAIGQPSTIRAELRPDGRAAY